MIRGFRDRSSPTAPAEGPGPEGLDVPGAAKAIAGSASGTWDEAMWGEPAWADDGASTSSDDGDPAQDLSSTDSDDSAFD